MAEIEDGLSADEFKRSIYSSVLSAEESKKRAAQTLSDDHKIWLEVDAEARKIKLKEKRKKKSDSIEKSRRDKAFKRSVKLQVAKQERNKVLAKRTRKKRDDVKGRAKRDRDIKNTAKFIERLKSYIPDTHETIRKYRGFTCTTLASVAISHELPYRVTNEFIERVQGCIGQAEERARGSEKGYLGSQGRGHGVRWISH